MMGFCIRSVNGSLLQPLFGNDQNMTLLVIELHKSDFCLWSIMFSFWICLAVIYVDSGSCAASAVVVAFMVILDS